jgi:hypothetical protein
MEAWHSLALFEFKNELFSEPEIGFIPSFMDGFLSLLECMLHTHTLP